MASLGQIIFCSMITLIILFSALIILILALTFSSTTPKVLSLNVFPIANLGEDKLLSCSLHRKGDVSFLNRVSVTWKKMGLSGFVYQYENGAPNFSGQSPEFEGRTQIFPDVLVRGNGSLLLRSVRRSDEGVYTCSIDSSDGSGIVNIHFRTAAFTAPTFTLSGGVLTARARRWFPEPKVKWLNEAQVVLRGRTNLTENSAGIYSVVSTLQPVNASEDYTCQIKNDLVIAMSKVKITGINVFGSTYFILGTASSLLASTYLIMMTSVLLCMFYLT